MQSLDYSVVTTVLVIVVGWFRDFQHLESSVDTLAFSFSLRADHASRFFEG
jgi:hypothetical protein